MNNEISSINEGLRYLYQARKECRNTLYAKIKIDAFRFLLGNIATARRIPWRTLAYVAGIACVAGIVGGKVFSKKG